MSPSRPFVDQETGTIDTTQILVEAIPLAKLVGLFVALALIPFGLVLLVLGNSVLETLFMVVAQFILAVGTGIVLLYIIARGIYLSKA